MARLTLCPKLSKAQSRGSPWNDGRIKIRASCFSSCSLSPQRWHSRHCGRKRRPSGWMHVNMSGHPHWWPIRRQTVVEIHALMRSSSPFPRGSSLVASCVPVPSIPPSPPGDRIMRDLPTGACRHPGSVGEWRRHRSSRPYPTGHGLGLHIRCIGGSFVIILHSALVIVVGRCIALRP